jgi:2-keto-3-deoxy-L-rhamnonate aldolase RhmA
MALSLRDIIRNSLRDKLARDEVAASMIVRLCRTVEIVRIAKTAGFDSLYVDLEHNAFSLDTASQLCMAALEAGIAALVRVPANTPDYIQRVLDAGAVGIIAPHIRTAKEAEDVVRCVKFPPEGERSAGGQIAILQFRSFPTPEANAAINDGTMVVAMLETKEGLDNVEEIAAVAGVDMLLIGTNDLTAELGIPGQYGHDLVHDAFARTIAACRKRSKHVGIGGLTSRPDLVEKFVKMGCRYVSTGSDLGFMMDVCAERAKAVKVLAT